MAFAASVEPCACVVLISTRVFSMSRASCWSAGGGGGAAELQAAAPRVRPTVKINPRIEFSPCMTFTRQHNGTEGYSNADGDCYFGAHHHHMLHTCEQVTGPILSANLHLLFWLSLFPITTAWMGENHFAGAPAARYGLVLLMAAL